MPELAPIGLIDNVDERTFEPIVIPIVGYTLDAQPVTRRFRFWPTLNFDAAVNLYRDTKADGSPREAAIFEYLDKCLIPDDLEDFWAFVGQRPVGGDPAVVVEQTTIRELYRALVGEYGRRPTLPLSDSLDGSSTPSPTSAAAANANRSSSPRSRSRAA